MANRALHHALESEVLQLRTFKLCETALALWLDWIDNDGDSGFWNRVDEDAVEQIRCSLSIIVSQLSRAKLRRRCADAQFVPVRPLRTHRAAWALAASYRTSEFVMPACGALSNAVAAEDASATGNHSGENRYE